MAMPRILLLLLLSSTVVRASSLYTEAMYRRALTAKEDESIFVLITVHDQAHRTERLVCVEAPFLTGAIGFQHHLGIAWDHSKNHSKEVETALSQPNRTFSFSNPDARENVVPWYSGKVLSEIRRRLASKVAADLPAAALALDEKCYQHAHRNGNISAAWREYVSDQSAIAHVLLEHGILVGPGDHGPPSHPIPENIDRLYLPRPKV